MPTRREEIEDAIDAIIEETSPLFRAWITRFVLDDGQGSNVLANRISRRVRNIDAYLRELRDIIRDGGRSVGGRTDDRAD
jgi:hypothetical protein